MRNKLVRALQWCLSQLRPQRRPEDVDAIAAYREMLNEAAEREMRQRSEYMVRAGELIEARHSMAGSGPWLQPEVASALTSPQPGRLVEALRESTPVSSEGAYGDIELALQNVQWRREINLSWLEFSRWGIQQIILICRLYYIKNPIIRRLIDVTAGYVFARGVEVSSPDQDANEVLKQFFKDNQKTLGQNALVDLERRKSYDGNLFFCLFPDMKNSGATAIRTIDATEIMDIVSDPNDSDKPWYYRRVWTVREFNPANGAVAARTKEAWYPALNFEPAAGEKPDTIQGNPVMWDSPILHRKTGAVAKWNFGCPRIYPAIDWARAATKFLQDCASLKDALAQVALTFTTKGGQAAIAAFKSQMTTTVGPGGGASLWDTNPPAVAASIAAMGPGSKLEAFNSRNASADPEEVRQYKLMCCMVEGVPETFLADVSTGNLATATSLDRPTETAMMERQEAWCEDLTTIGVYVLKTSKSAPGGKLREALAKRNALNVELEAGAWVMRESAAGSKRRVMEAVKSDSKIEVQTNFPAIREGDLPQLISATVDAMTLGNKGGTVIGIDEKSGVKKLFQVLGIENGDEIAEEMYPDGAYDPDRTNEPEPTADPKAAPALESALKRLGRAVKVYEATVTDHEHNHA